MCEPICTSLCDCVCVCVELKRFACTLCDDIHTAAFDTEAEMKRGKNTRRNNIVFVKLFVAFLLDRFDICM